MYVGEPLQADTATRDTATRAPDIGLKAGILFSNEGVNRDSGLVAPVYWF